jgi:hypothetical protein
VEPLRRGQTERKEQEHHRRQEKLDRPEMAGTPVVQEHPIPEQPGDKPGLPGVDERSRWETTLIPIALAILGLAMIFFAAFRVYPRTSEVPAPLFATLEVTASFPIDSINYRVDPQPPATARIIISVDLPNNTARPPAHRPAATLGMSLPPGASFWHCPKSICSGLIGYQKLTFHSMSGSAGEATATFFVKAGNFGVTTNGVTAAAAIPAVFWDIPEQGLLYTAYDIHSATAYEWSPAARDNTGHAVWTDPLAKGYTAGLTATGVNHSAQSRQEFAIFVAGALIALGGGAILTAIIEALHRRDWDAIRGLRSK